MQETQKTPHNEAKTKQAKQMAAGKDGLLISVVLVMPPVIVCYVRNGPHLTFEL